MESTFLWAQAIGLCAMAIAISAWQLKSSRHIIMCFIPCNSLWAIQYILLGAPLGAAMNICSVLKDTGLVFIKEKHVPYLIATFITVAWGVGLYNFGHWYDILPLMAATILNLGLLQRDNRALYARACIIASILWLAYNIIVHSWMGACCSSLVVISSMTGMARHEAWVLGKCYRSFMPSLARSLFVFPNLRTYP